jgi:hypothetical protein
MTEPVTDEQIARWERIVDQRFKGGAPTPDSAPVMMTYGDVRALHARIHEQQSEIEVLKADLESWQHAAQHD